MRSSPHFPTRLQLGFADRLQGGWPLLTSSRIHRGGGWRVIKSPAGEAPEGDGDPPSGYCVLRLHMRYRNSPLGQPSEADVPAEGSGSEKVNSFTKVTRCTPSDPASACVFLGSGSHTVTRLLVGTYIFVSVVSSHHKNTFICILYTYIYIYMK